MSKLSFIFLIQFVILAAQASSVKMPSGDCVRLPKGWQSVESHLLKKKMTYLQYKKTDLHAASDADFVVNRSKVSPKELFQKKCAETNAFFSKSAQTRMVASDGACKIEVQRQNQPAERVLLKLSNSSNSKVVVINTLSLAMNPQDPQHTAAAQEIEKAFNSPLKAGKCLR